jgi:hypothetical protein
MVKFGGFFMKTVFGAGEEGQSCKLSRTTQKFCVQKFYQKLEFRE